MIFVTDRTPTPQRVAREVEARGFESLFVPEKTHVPTSRATAWPGGELPEWYKRTLDPFVALAAAAAATTRLRVGTGVSLLALRDAVICAKEVASLDWLSDGRFEFGVGYGWNAEEFATHGVPIDSAAARLPEKLALMRALWRDEVAHFRGEHEQLEPSWAWPKPVQQPAPPVWIGARATRAVFDAIADHADGWMPIEGYGEICAQLPKLRAAFERAGRDPARARVSVYSSLGDRKQLDAYAQAGIERTIVTLPSADEGTLWAALDGHARMLEDWRDG